MPSMGSAWFCQSDELTQANHQQPAAEEQLQPLGAEFQYQVPRNQTANNSPRARKCDHRPYCLLTEIQVFSGGTPERQRLNDDGDGH